MTPDEQRCWHAAMRHFDVWLEHEASPERQAAVLAAAAAEGAAIRAQLDRLIAAHSGRTQSTWSPGPGATPLPEIPSETPPDVPGYRLVSPLGQGGMGDVWEAERQGDGFVQRVAIKCLRADLGGSQAHVRLLAERQILARLEHHHVARLLDAGVDAGGRPWLAMELVRGEPITRHVARHALPMSDRLRLFVDLCSAIADAHRHLVVHCDLKPSNVLVDEAGVVKVLDFGIARLVAPGDADATLIPAMTPAYAAPEQILGEPVSIATDVYALGLLLRELLTGVPPGGDLQRRLSGQDDDPTLRPSAIVLAHAETRRDPGHRRLARQLRGDLDAIVAQALYRRPQDRYADVGQLMQDVQAWLDGRPVQAARGSLTYRIGKFLLRHRYAAAASLVAVAALFTATIWSWQAAERERRARADAEVALATAEQNARRAQQTKEFVVSMIKDIRPLEAARGQGTAYTAAQWLKDSGERVRADLEGMPEVQLPLHVAFTQALMQLAETDAALAENARALELLAQSDDPWLRGEALLQRARMRAERNQLRDARADGQAALALFEGMTGNPEAPPMAIGVRTTLAKIATFANQMEEAETQYRQILTDRAAYLGNEDAPELAVDWNNLGSIQALRGRYAEAEAAYRRAFALFTMANGTTHPRAAWLHLGVGLSMLGQGKPDAATVELALAEEIVRTRLAPTHPLMAQIHSAQATAARLGGDLARCRQLLERSLELDPPGNRLDRAENQLRLAGLAWREGRIGEARAWLAAANASLHDAETAADEPIPAWRDLLSALIEGGPVPTTEVRAQADALTARWGKGMLRSREIDWLLSAR